MKLNTKIKRALRISWALLRALIVLVVVTLMLTYSVIPPGGLSSQVHSITRDLEFDFITWTLNAVFSKISDWGFSFEKFMPQEQQSDLVLEYLEKVQTVNTLNAEILLIYANPDIPDPETASKEQRTKRDTAHEELEALAPMAESILQSQLMTVIHQEGLGILGQVLPPSLYKTSEIPYSLVISPRTSISQILDISLKPGLETEVMEQIENSVIANLDHSALVVPIGGIGTYPTMIMQTTNIVWLTEVIAHEWTHNFLTLRPLGINYGTNAELRTINETVASLSGKELGRLLLEIYYPAYVPAVKKPEETQRATPQPKPDPNVFDFRTEMRITRVEVDRFLAQGEVEAAEQYMETRREFFWDQGYLIRKLNQAYFAFYGAYNDEPGGGASGEDPIGPAVTAYRNHFDSLGDFLNAISWINSFDDLLERLDRLP
jgi:hypothetical protein